MHQFNRTQDVSLISPHNAAECKILEYPEIISDQNHVSGNSVRTRSTSDTPVSIVLSDIASGDIDSTVSQTAVGREIKTVKRINGLVSPLMQQGLGVDLGHTAAFDVTTKGQLLKTKIILVYVKFFQSRLHEKVKTVHK